MEIYYLLYYEEKMRQNEQLSRQYLDKKVSKRKWSTLLNPTKKIKENKDQEDIAARL